MEDLNIFILGVFMSVLFVIGLFFTFKEFSEIDPEQQEKEYSRRKNITIDKDG